MNSKVNKDNFRSTQVKPQLLTNARLQSFKEEWEMMYESKSMHDIVLRNILNITDRVLSGELIVESA